MPLQSFGVPAPVGAVVLTLRLSSRQVESAVPVMPLQSCVAPRGASAGAPPGAVWAQHSVPVNASAANANLGVQRFMTSSDGMSWLNFAAG